jgi:hypothetical protein
MSKIRKFRISPRPASVLKNLKALTGDAHTTPELESAVDSEMRRAGDLYATAALYDTLEPGRTPEALADLWQKPADGAAEPVALTLYAATIGPRLEDALGDALSRGEGLMSRVLTAVGEEAADQAAAFVQKLVAEEAVQDGLELYPRREAAVDRRGEALALLGADKIGVTLDAAGHLTPRFTRVGGILWYPAKKRK